MRIQDKGEKNQSLTTYSDLISKDHNLIKIIFINSTLSIDRELIIQMMKNGWQFVINDYSLFQKLREMNIDDSKSSIRYVGVSTEEEKKSEIESLVYPRRVNTNARNTEEGKEFSVKIVKPLCVYVASLMSDIIPSRKATFSACLDNCLDIVKEYMDFIGEKGLDLLLFDISEYISKYYPEYSKVMDVNVQEDEKIS